MTGNANDVYILVNHALKGCTTVLNLCAGKNKSRLSAAEHAKIVHADICEVWMDKAQYEPNEQKVVCDVTKINDIYSQKSFEAVVCVEGIEHLKYEDGVKLVEDAEKIAYRMIIFTTPHFFSTDTVLDGNPYNAHLSFFPVEFWKDRGYAVTVIGNGLVAIKII